MAAVDFGVDSVNENAASHLWALLTRTNKALNLNRYNNGNLETLNSGKVSGPLLCGCLTVIVACIGTQFCPDFNGAVLVLEDIGGRNPINSIVLLLFLHYMMFSIKSVAWYRGNSPGVILLKSVRGIVTLKVL